MLPSVTWFYDMSCRLSCIVDVPLPLRLILYSFYDFWILTRYVCDHCSVVVDISFWLFICFIFNHLDFVLPCLLLFYPVMFLLVTACITLILSCWFVFLHCVVIYGYIREFFTVRSKQYWLCSIVWFEVDIVFSLDTFMVSMS